MHVRKISQDVYNQMLTQRSAAQIKQSRIIKDRNARTRTQERNLRDRIQAEKFARHLNTSIPYKVDSFLLKALCK